MTGRLWSDSTSRHRHYSLEDDAAASVRNQNTKRQRRSLLPSAYNPKNALGLCAIPQGNHSEMKSPKSNRGGRRAGAGRPRNDPPIRELHVRLTEEQIKLLRMWGRGDLCAGLRWLIDTVAPLIHKQVDQPLSAQTDAQAGTDSPHNSG